MNGNQKNATHVKGVDEPVPRKYISSMQHELLHLTPSQEVDDRLRKQVRRIYDAFDGQFSEFFKQTQEKKTEHRRNPVPGLTAETIAAWRRR